MDEKYREINGTSYRPSTPERVIEVLESARLPRFGRRVQRLRIFYGNPDTGLDRCRTFSVVGYVGRTTGRLKCPVLCHNVRSLGGDLVDDHLIVKIMDTRTKRVLYVHPDYQLPWLEIYLGDNSDYPFEVCKVRHAWGIPPYTLARCATDKQAHNYIRFLTGHRMRI